MQLSSYTHLDGVIMHLFMIADVASNCNKIESLSLCGITDPDSGASLRVLSTASSLRVLSVSCWSELCDEAVSHIVTECSTLQSLTAAV